MGFSIAQAAERTGLTAHTLRYYDKEGLLPYVERDAVGNRVFQENDFEWLKTITCLKNTGMPLKQIRQFVQWAMDGKDTTEQRLRMFLEHKKTVEQKMAELQGYMDRIDYKIGLYQAILEEREQEEEKRVS